MEFWSWNRPVLSENFDRGQNFEWESEKRFRLMIYDFNDMEIIKINF